MILGRLLALAALILVLPTLKNAYLYTQYQHEPGALVRAWGEPESLAGRWEATYDTYPCGIDTRTRVTLTLDADGSGRLTEVSFGDRIGPDGSGFPYSWTSLLPYDPNGWMSVSTSSVRDSLGTLIIRSDESADVARTRYALYRQSGDELSLWETSPPGVLPVKRWDWFPARSPDLRDLAQPWW